VTDQLRDLVNEYVTKGELSLRELGRRAKVQSSVLTRFMSKREGISVKNADKLCAALDLQLTPRSRSRRP
jgi:hypothetical protein